MLMQYGDEESRTTISALSLRYDFCSTTMKLHKSFIHFSQPMMMMMMITSTVPGTWLGKGKQEYMLVQASTHTWNLIRFTAAVYCYFVILALQHSSSSSSSSSHRNRVQIKENGLYSKAYILHMPPGSNICFLFEHDEPNFFSNTFYIFTFLKLEILLRNMITWW